MRIPCGLIFRRYLGLLSRQIVNYNLSKPPRLALWLILSQLLIVPFTRAALQIQVGQNFNGSDNSGNFISPADSDGAIGPEHFVEFINGIFAIYNKTNGANISRIGDDQFWLNAGVSFSPFDNISDPRLVYDPSVQRWFASQVDFDSSTGDPTELANRFLIAVSDTADPTGAWHGAAFVADPKSGFFADFPTLGLDANAVYLSGDMFSSNNPAGCTLWSIPKADLLINEKPAIITNATSFGIMSFDERGEILQPAICFDGSGVGNILAAGDIFVGTNLVASRILDAGTTNATLQPATVIAVEPYTYPIDASQPDGSSDLADNEARLSASTYTLGGILYAAQSVEIDNRAAIRWYRIDATNQTLIESGNITDPDLDLFFPSIAVTKNGVMLICCNGSSTNVPVSSYGFVGQTVNGASSFSGPQVLEAGTIPNYHAGFGESRWGDYSTTSLDPSDPSRFWTIQMIPLTSSTWTTRITEVLVIPQLTLTRSNANMNLSWPLFAEKYRLQSTTNLLGNWDFVPQTPATNASAETISVTLPAIGQQFFRLIESQ
jgi:hypothetical protein